MHNTEWQTYAKAVSETVGNPVPKPKPNGTQWLFKKASNASNNLKNHSSTKIEEFDTSWLRNGGSKILKVFVSWDETAVSLGADKLIWIPSRILTCSEVSGSIHRACAEWWRGVSARAVCSEPRLWGPCEMQRERPCSQVHYAITWVVVCVFRNPLLIAKCLWYSQLHKLNVGLPPAV